MGVRAAAKAFAVYQPEKVLIPSTKGKIPRLHHLLSEYSNRQKANQGHI